MTLKTIGWAGAILLAVTAWGAGHGVDVINTWLAAALVIAVVANDR